MTRRPKTLVEVFGEQPTPTDAEVEAALLLLDGPEYRTLRAALAAKDAEIERLRARLKSNREMYQRGHAAGFREAAEWLEETLRAKKEAGVWPNWMEPAARALRAEADRREGEGEND